jgi:hypothetical protein
MFIAAIQTLAFFTQTVAFAQLSLYNEYLLINLNSGV